MPISYNDIPSEEKQASGDLTEMLGDYEEDE